MLCIAFAALLAYTTAGKAEVVPVPRQKPDRGGIRWEAAIAVPRPNPRRDAVHDAGLGATGGGKRADRVAAARSACRKMLAGIAMAYEFLPPIGNGHGCGAPAPIALSQVAGVRLVPAATVNCAVAFNLHRWITASVQPAAIRRLNNRVTKIHVAASYVCRRRNNQRSAKISEHARANALDMSGFAFARAGAVSVGRGWGGSFLNDIRRGACGYFTTVLGPGSDRHHGDHFHVDGLARRNGFRVCR